MTESRIINSKGTDLTKKSSHYSATAVMTFPGTAAAVYEFNSGKKYEKFPQEKVDNLIKMYKLNAEQIIPKTGKMKVIFSCLAVPALINRFTTAANPIGFYNKITPLMEKMNQKIFSSKLTISQDPLNDSRPGAVAFDDEGSPCQELVFVQNGVLKTIFNDLNYAAKLQMEPTGNAFKNSLEFQPSAQPAHLIVQPGEKTLEEIIEGIDEGILASGLMGAHSGNVLTGEYSVGISTGFYIKDGKLIGRVKDCMIAGNIYETFNNILEIENETQDLGFMHMPAILFDQVSVSGE